MKVYDDTDAWRDCHPDDRWIFDKLLLATKLGYKCGPKGVPVPEPGTYIVRPCINLLGMGRGAHLRVLHSSTDDLPDGTFWCEIFTGRHLSVDFHMGQALLCVEGIKAENEPTRWQKWVKTGDSIEIPDILLSLKGEYEWMNVEYIGGNIIEVHLRRNPDFLFHNAPYIVPTYDCREMKGHVFVDWADYERLGFFIPEGY